MLYSLLRYAIMCFADAYGMQQTCTSLPWHLSAIWIRELLLIQVDPCNHRNSNLQTAFNPRRPLSIANALDDSSYEEAPSVARYAAGLLLDGHVENGPLIQATPVGDGSPNKC